MSPNSSSEELLPSSPYIGVRPPTNMAERDRRKFVYGFPLTHEWVRHRYHHEVELEAVKGVQIESRGSYMMRLFRRLTSLCEEIHRVDSKVTMVETSGYGYGQALFLVVGYRRKPPPDTLLELIDKVANYGVVELPRWYPKI